MSVNPNNSEQVAMLAIERVLEALDSMAQSQRDMVDLAQLVLAELKDAKSQSAITNNSQ